MDIEGVEGGKELLKSIDGEDGEEGVNTIFVYF